MVFISHRSIDKEVADLLYEFFVATGIDNKTIFCSSLPGNDVKEKISFEVKANLQQSCVNIVILSSSYYESAFCLNEAGVIWFNDTIPTIPIALPEISDENMYGFLNSEYKLRRLDNENDISYIYDVICDATKSERERVSVLTPNIQKLKKRYLSYINDRENKVQNPSQNYKVISLTDDEIITLEYVLRHKVRKVNKIKFSNWLIDSEIYDIDIDNAFDLLSTISGSQIIDDTLEIGTTFFRELTSDQCPIKKDVIDNVVKQHQHYSSDAFIDIWNNKGFDDKLILFVSYIIDENVTSFGDRWMSEAQISHIKEWESKNTLDAILSVNYSSCLNYFIDHRFVFPSSWTSHGNPREFTLCKSLRKLIFNTDLKNDSIFRIAKENYTIQLPF